MSKREDVRPEERLEGVERRLRELREGYEREGDVRKVFTFAYELITTELIRVIDTERGYFRDVAWIIGLNEVFAGTYFEAVQRYDNGGIFAGGVQRANSPWWWEKVFVEIGVPERTDWSSLEALVYPMMAHIIGDLPYALLEVGAEQRHLHDFHQLNDLIADTIDEVQQRVSCRYAPRQLIADRLLGRYDEKLSASGIRLARSLAWYNALRLSEECRLGNRVNGHGPAPQTATEWIVRHYGDDSLAVQQAIRDHLGQFVEFRLSAHLMVRLFFRLARFFSDHRPLARRESKQPGRQPRS